MNVIANKWVEKERKKKKLETAPAFESNPIDPWIPVNLKDPIKRFTFAARATMKRTLRGVRK